MNDKQVTELVGIIKAAFLEEPTKSELSPVDALYILQDKLEELLERNANQAQTIREERDGAQLINERLREVLDRIKLISMEPRLDAGQAIYMLAAQALQDR